MTQHGDTEELLARELTHGARRFEGRGGQELGIDQVLGRARSIRRRRRTATGLAAAAAVLAVVAPTLLLQDHSAKDPLPAGPVQVDRLSLRDLPTGAEPATGWLAGSTWHATDGDTRALDQVVDARILGLTPVGELLVVWVETRNGTMGAAVAPDGAVRDLGPVTGAPVRSAGGDVAAVVAPDGSVTAVQDEDGITVTALPKVTVETPQVVEVVGEDCREGSAGCTVFVEDAGVEPATWSSSSGGDVEQAPWPRVDAIAADGTVAEKTSVDEREPGSCSSVHDPAGTELWHTCKASFLAFSPAGDRLLGTSPYVDGLGSGELMVYDTRDGSLRLHLRTVDGTTITDMVWEDDDHVLALVVEGTRWAVVRIGVDGTAELALPSEKGTMDRSPYRLPED